MLPPGAVVVIDAEVQRSWDQLKRDFREIRGNFLAGCFEIEYQLDRLLCEILFPGSNDANAKSTDLIPVTVESARVLRELFDELILKPGSLPMISFAFKINLFEQLSTRISAVRSLTPEGLVKRLDSVRRIRNRFAHYPVAFKPEGQDPNRKLRAVLVCRDAEINLDSVFFEQNQALFGAVLANLTELVAALSANADRPPEQP